jgi:flavin reductase (DIM6/NTAB) family NADH-FMN oxidoreductase RutF
VNVDVTNNHLFLGYKPLILGLYFRMSEDVCSILIDHPSIQLNFYTEVSTIGKIRLSEKNVARLVLQCTATKDLNGYRVFFCRGVHGEHKFLSPLNQLVNRKREQFRKREIGNVDLPGNLIEQVRIAYAVPRIISIITVSDGVNINMFPTDLHGPVDEDFYLGSLRQGGKANQQVEEIGKIVISEMPLNSYKEVYRLGKNHMRELSEHAKFSLHQWRSGILDFPLPSGALHYRELELLGSTDIGIHRIHMYRILNTKIIHEGETLSHIHQYYAQWRLDHSLPTHFLLR